jgi:FMNH2-dependent dimethyl sulfone monooxygenase
MQFGLYAPVPHVTVGSEDIARSIRGALGPLDLGVVDPQMTLAKRTILAADEAGFDIVLFAERHRGPDLEAWILAAAVSSWTKRIRTMPAVHPGLWHPTLIAKMAATVDRITPGRSAINLVTGWNEAEARMFGGDVLLHNDDRYVRAEEFVTVMRGMWANTPFSHTGKYYDVQASELLLKPACNIEIFTASRSSRGLDMVARVADWWFVDFDKSARTPREVLASLKDTIADMTARAARYGRRVRFAFNPYVAFGDSADDARAQAEGLLMAAASDSDRSMMTSYMGPAMRAGCIGRPADVRRQLTAYIELGIELFLFKFVPRVEDIQAIRDEVIVPLRGA